MAICPTVKVKNADGFMIINESDFDAKVHKKYKEPAADKKAAETAETAKKEA